MLNSPNNLVEDEKYHRTVGDGRVGSYAEPKAAGLLKAGWHVGGMSVACRDDAGRRELQRGVEVMRGHSFDLSETWLHS